MYKKKNDTRYPIDQTPLLVFCHENAGNIGVRIPFFELLIDNLGVNVLSMAYRGYSYSDPVKPTEEGLKKDADALVSFLKDPDNSRHPELAKHINPQLIFAHGRSLGGAVAIYMTNKNPDLFRGLIVESAFTSISDMADAMFPFIKYIKGPFLKIDWNNTREV